MTAYEDMLKSVGEFGLYQKVRIFLFCLPAISAALHNMSMVFNMETPEFRCAVPGLPSDTYAVQSEHHAHLINASLPRDEKTGGYSRCYTYRPSAKNSLGPWSNRSGANETSQLIFDRNQTAPCERWVYSKDVHESTVTSHLNLVCERDGVRTHQSMMMLMGLLVGSLICTPLADWIGRKKVLIVCGLLQMVLGFCFVFITSVSWLLGLRFLIAITGLGTFFAGFVLSTEIVGPSHRAMAGVCAMYFWAVGMFLLVFLFYFIRDWRIAQVTLTAPGLLYISYWWIIPESPRWLILKGRHYEADKVLRSMATTNRRPVPEQMLNDLATSAETDVTKASLREEQQQQQQQQQRQQQGQNLRQQLWLLFSSPALAGRFLNLCFNWLAINVCYYGLTLNVGSLLEGELYFNFTLLTIMELAGFVVAHLLLDRLGRKPVYCCCMLLGGVACLATLGPVLTKSDMTWINMTLSNIGKFGCTVCFASVFVFTAELLPTFVRNSGLGLCSMVGRIGGIISPYIVSAGQSLGGDLSRAVPLVVFGSLAVLAGLLALLIPETSNTSLPETAQDLRNMRSQKLIQGKQLRDNEAGLPLKEAREEDDIGTC